MNLSLQIQPAELETSNANLYLEISSQGLSYIILEGDACVALVIYNFDEGVSNDTTVGYIHQVVADQPVLLQKFNKVHIIYSYAPSILVPMEYMNEAGNNALLELVYGEANERVTRTDFMYRHGIHNVYGVPSVIEQVVTRYFGYCGYSHLFSWLPDVVKYPGNHLYCIFSKGRLKVLLIRDGKLQVMQNYLYKTPGDVAYHLLNLCKSFDLEVDGIMLHLSGMIDENSALFSELRIYFTQFQLAALPDQYKYPEEINQYPTHYYSHLFAIASCV